MWCHRSELSSWKLSSSSTLTTAIAYMHVRECYSATYIPVIIEKKKIMLNFGGCDLYSGATYILANTVLYITCATGCIPIQPSDTSCLRKSSGVVPRLPFRPVHNAIILLFPDMVPLVG